MDLLISVTMLFLGWMLGLLSPVIVRSIEQRRNARATRNAINEELKELAVRLANVYSLIVVRFGDCKREDYKWLLSVIERCGKESRDPRFEEGLRKQLELNDEGFDAVVATQRAKENEGVGLKKFRAPYLTAKVGDLSLFSEDDQRALLEILANLEIFNEEVDMARYYFDLTYNEALSKENQDQVRSSVMKSYLNVSARAKIVVDDAVEQVSKSSN